jgi:hypothetical protein
MWNTGITPKVFGYVNDPGNPLHGARVQRRTNTNNTYEIVEDYNIWRKGDVVVLSSGTFSLIKPGDK